MSLLVNGFLAPSCSYESIPRTTLSARLASCLPASGASVYLVTVDAGPYGPLSITLKCDVSRTAATGIIFGRDWAALLRDLLISMNYRLDSFFNPWAFISDVTHPLRTVASSQSAALSCSNDIDCGAGSDTVGVPSLLGHEIPHLQTPEPPLAQFASPMNALPVPRTRTFCPSHVSIVLTILFPCPSHALHLLLRPSQDQSMHHIKVQSGQPAEETMGHRTYEERKEFWKRSALKPVSLPGASAQARDDGQPPDNCIGDGTAFRQPILPAHHALIRDASLLVPREDVAETSTAVEPDTVAGVAAKHNLNTEQAGSFSIVTQHSESKSSKPLQMFLGGPGGTAKS
ncbi:hypothetical protein B0H17DRAFT_460108 [Mycena rosella]|uniref:Uncharacterized protein n=1 Tax=Mycena rosella TaxID=1033263 RepID=A0AAD7FWI3_MYCRO|nr:hypothetical protein B0H17DRAFT_460108 [Mycena rosella]